MNKGVVTVNYPVQDLARAKELYRTLLGVEPFKDETYFVGFMVGQQSIGLVPGGHEQGMTGPAGYYEVDNIRESLQALLNGGAKLQQDVTDTGGGKLIASVTDPDGNVIGLVQMP